jgi:enterochelin esterase family protein
MKSCFVLFLMSVAFAADKVPVLQLIEMSRQNPTPAGFRDAVAATLGEADMQKGTAVAGEGPEFFWAVDSTMTPVLVLDEDPPLTMQRIQSSNTWFHAGRLTPGTSHMFHYVIGGAPFGGKNDVAAYLSESYAHPNVPQGTLSAKIVHTSKIYPGMETNYWIYVPAQYDPKTPAALMVWQDGEGHINRGGGSRIMNVVDNLIYEGRIPVMIQVFISPGVVGDKKMRSIEYDTVDDTYDRFLRDEILADVQKQYNLRQDSYSRGIAGSSSGGICSFNAAWFHPELFSRVLSRIGSFTSIQWHPGVIDGGNVYPFKIRKEAKRNIRVWLQDGSNDLENEHGSWPLQNIEMANSLKRQGYDFHLSFGTGTHNGAHGNSEAPRELAWLWRDYDPSKTEQTYEMEASEAAKPLFRVKLLDR